MKKSDSKSRPNVFESLLKELSLEFNPNAGNLVISFPSLPSMKSDGKVSPLKGKDDVNIEKEDKITSESGKIPSESVKEKEREVVDVKVDIKDSIEEDLTIDDLDAETEPVRVKIELQAYLKLALHSLKYANKKLPKKKWVEVIGLLVGYIENKDSPLARLIITDAYPIGHGTDVNAQIRDPQSLVRVYKVKEKGTHIIGWYHSHPSYGAWMSDTDYHTQVRYQRLARETNELTAPIALVIDPTRISSRSYGFKIFRLKNNYKKWEEPRFEVIDCPVGSVPGIIKATMPLAEGKKKLYLEYDYET